MLPRENRIKKKKDFELIFKNSKSFKNSLFILKASKNNLNFNRFGFVVSQKVSKKAVTRNKIRRRLAQIMKVKDKDIKSGTDLIFIVLSGADKKEFPEMQALVESALIKMGLINF